MMDDIFTIEDSAMEEWRKGNPMRWIEIAADDVRFQIGSDAFARDVAIHEILIHAGPS